MFIQGNARNKLFIVIIKYDNLFEAGLRKIMDILSATAWKYGMNISIKKASDENI